jgi:P27 family predicted phage terminase small subunit
MGRRGYAAKPTALKILHGDRKDRINFDEPKPLDEPLVCPDWLSPGAKIEWDHIAPHLTAMGTVLASDEAILAAYCETYDRYQRVCQLADNLPPVFNRAKKGEPPEFVKNPLYGQVRDLTAELRVVARELGLTPSARAGLRVTVAVQAPVERLFTTG